MYGLKKVKGIGEDASKKKSTRAWRSASYPWVHESIWFGVKLERKYYGVCASSNSSQVPGLKDTADSATAEHCI